MVGKDIKKNSYQGIKCKKFPVAVTFVSTGLPINSYATNTDTYILHTFPLHGLLCSVLAVFA